MRLRGFVISGIFLLLIRSSSIAQVHTARNISMTANSDGYYEYLPQGYNSGSQNYPLILYIHGMGEVGNVPLSILLGAGIPGLINQGQFPVSFTVNGHTSSFIVISPHFNPNWPVPTDIQDILNYVTQHYRVDQNRIYMTGLSMGGGVTWDYAAASSIYANRLAAIVPIAGASLLEFSPCRVIATANLPVWATHNDQDPIVPVFNTNSNTANINSSPSPNPLAKKTILIGTSHDAWTQTYDPTWRDGGLNIYEWMLQYHRANSTLPVTLVNYSVSITKPEEVTICWTTTQEQNNAYFTIERSTGGINFISIGRIDAANLATGSNYIFKDNNPVKGKNYYRLSQTDIAGKIVYFEIKKVSTILSQNILQVYPNPVTDNLTLEMNNSAMGKIKITVIDGAGKIVKTAILIKAGNYLQEILPVHDLKAGYYVIRIEAADYSSSLSFLKK